jgi:hypothetical protein
MNLHESCEVGLVLSRINVLILVIIKKPKKPIEANINTGGLNHVKVERVKSHTTGAEFTANIAVRKKHDTRLVD